MEYIYVAPNCPRCDELKKKLNSQGIVFAERHGERLTNPAVHDDIDIDGFAQLCSQNMMLPVQISREDT